ncbi:MAG: tyrosine--tRNA ligase, partial [Candidatus Sulfotelmatobacter sp.]
AIGIHEPPLEMYGKVMSISDEMMWRYYELLTDLQVADIEKMKREVHPMQAKKELARRIVADFHSGEAATRAGEDWGKQFQKSEVPDEAEEVVVKLRDIEWSISEDSGMSVAGDQPRFIKLDRLLVKSGLADSATDATRKLKQGSVRIGDEVFREPRTSVTLPAASPLRLPLRVGKRLRVAVIEF